MKDQSKTKAQLLKEMTEMRLRIAELEKSDTGRTGAVTYLKESEELYRTLMEMSPDSVVMYSFSGEILAANTRAAKVYGLSNVDDFLREVKSIFDLLTEDGKRYALARLNGTSSEEPFPENEYLVRIRDGTLIPMEINTSIVRTATGKPRAYISVIRNITKRKAVEQALRESEDLFRSTFEQAAVGIAHVSLDGRFIRVNQRFCNIVGYGREEALNLTFRDITYPDDLETDRNHVQQIMEGLIDTYSIEKRYIRKDGHLVWVNLTVALLREETGRPLYFIMAVEDITERKRSEAELLHLATAIEQAAEGILLTDTNWIIQYANPAFEKMLGYGKGEMIGWHTRLLKSGKHDRMFYRNIRETLTGGKVWSGRGINKRKDGTFIDVDVTISPVRDKSGNIINYVYNHRDITREIALENRLLQSQKLESIGTLAGGIAHDFNNLLMGIQGYASLLLMNLDPSDPNYGRLKNIEEQVKSGADLTKQLLGFAQDGGYEIKPTNINDIIQKTSSIFERTNKEITIHRNYREDLWPVEVDQEQMEQVFMNLYVNARQAMPEGGELCLTAENFLLGDDHTMHGMVKPGRYVKVSITDTGTGMDEKTLERIFDPFFTTKGMGRGMGLGLAAAYGIIRGHKGMMNVTSELGHGTTFDIYLPVTEKTIIRDKDSRKEDLKGTEMILLVDDEKMVLDVNKELLELLGYRVYTAGNGQEAIAIYTEKKNEIDLVILDMIMPGMSGGETFDRLRSINPNVKVLLSTGYSIKGRAQEILNRGCNGFIQKPFKLKNLSQKVQEMLD